MWSVYKAIAINLCVERCTNYYVGPTVFPITTNHPSLGNLKCWIQNPELFCSHQETASDFRFMMTDDMVNAKEMQSSMSTEVWDEVAISLERDGGVATVNLPSASEALHAHSFAVARQAFDRISSSNDSVLSIPADADSAHATGHHAAGAGNSMSRYNTHREGFVFSDGATLKVQGLPEFDPAMTALFESLHEITKHVLLAVERKLDLPKDWFQQTLGPTDMSSQWHVKRYVTVENEDKIDHGKPCGEGEESILLPMHTDPSIISVVIHDAEGKNPSAMGLQCYAQTSDNKRIWKEVPFHGHAVATIFVGSVLSHITGGLWPSIKHRVVETPDVENRVAATLFLRPKGSSLLQVPPSPFLKEVTLRKKITFDTWNARVSKNYSKKKENRV
jgi:isopenicillin N synthase-like dioxygenase